MSFIYPAFLYALSLIAIPIIIHLFNFRRYKKIYFTNVRFLKEIKAQTNKQSKLKHLLILLSRIAAIVFLVLAFAQPYIPNPKKNSHTSAPIKSVSVYIDNSFSMEAIVGSMTLLEMAKKKAKEIALAYSVQDKFQLITNELSGSQQNLYTREIFLNKIEEVVLSPNTVPLSKIYKRQVQALGQSANTDGIIYMLSDLQTGIADFKNITKDSLFSQYIIPVQGEEIDNVYIDTCWLMNVISNENDQKKMVVRIKNSGEEEREAIRLEVKLNGINKGISNFSLLPDGEIYDTINFTSDAIGWNQIEVKVTDHPITFDNTYYYSFYAEGPINLLNIYDEQPNKFIQTFFKNNSHFNPAYQSLNQLDYSSIAGYKLIILDELPQISSGLANALNSFVKNGGSIFLIPASDLQLSGYNDFLSGIEARAFAGINTEKRNISKINMVHIIYNNVFEKLPDNLTLPQVQYSVIPSGAKSLKEEWILTFEDGYPALSSYKYHNGYIYVAYLPFNIDASDIATHSLFPPLLYNMAVSSQGVKQQTYIIGKDNLVELPHLSNSNQEVYIIRGKGSEFIPERKNLQGKVFLDVHDQIKQAGIYEYYIGQSQLVAEGNLAFNYDRIESSMQYITADELSPLAEKSGFRLIQDIKTDLSRQLVLLEQGTSLWRSCILLVLLFLAIEVLLLRFWK